MFWFTNRIQKDSSSISEIQILAKLKQLGFAVFPYWSCTGFIKRFRTQAKASRNCDVIQLADINAGSIITISVDERGFGKITADG